MLRTDHHEQNKPRREMEFERQEEAGILRQVMEVGVAGYHKRGFQRKKPPWTGKEGSLGVSRRQCES